MVLTPLDLFGWKKVEEYFISLLDNPDNDKMVLLFPHTSAWDTVITLFYILWDKNVNRFRKRFKFIVWDESYRMPLYNNVYKYLGAIPVPHSSKRESGMTEKIFEELDKHEKFILLISPKGSCEKIEWRSGWYHIAKRYDASILVAGPDYEKHIMDISGEPEKINGRSYEEMEDVIKPKFSEIVPLWPEREIVPIKDHSTSTLFDRAGFIAVVLIVIILLVIVLLAMFRPSSTQDSYDAFRRGVNFSKGSTLYVT